VLTEDNYQEMINSYAKQDWAPLLELIPELEETREHGAWVDPPQNKNGIHFFSYVEYADVVTRFISVIHHIPIIVHFPWAQWDEGRKISGDENFDYDTIDVPTKCKLITAIMRNDRFCTGALLSAFESEMMLKILKSIERQVNT